VQLQDLTVDVLWRDVVARIEPGSKIPTLKGGKRNGVEVTAEVISVDPDAIKIRLDKGDVREIKKDYYTTVLAKLREQGRVRQLNVPGTTERYVLGVLKLLPYFEAVKEYDPSEGKEKHFITFVG